MARRIVIAPLFFMIAAFFNAPLNAEDIIKRWASGEVVATNTQAKPNVIVIKTKNWKGLDFIVGADVEETTMIMKGKNKAGLGDIKPGDKVDIVYERNMRVIAKSIKIGGKEK